MWKYKENNTFAVVAIDEKEEYRENYKKSMSHLRLYIGP
jgi:hypothetical protein